MNSDAVIGAVAFFFIIAIAGLLLLWPRTHLPFSDYCPEGFGKPVLVIHENGTWTCEERD